MEIYPMNEMKLFNFIFNLFFTKIYGLIFILSKLLIIQYCLRVKNATILIMAFYTTQLQYISYVGLELNVFAN